MTLYLKYLHSVRFEVGLEQNAYEAASPSYWSRSEYLRVHFVICQEAIRYLAPKFHKTDPVSGAKLQAATHSITSVIQKRRL